jgi:hypothetical protein
VFSQFCPKPEEASKNLYAFRSRRESVAKLHGRARVRRNLVWLLGVSEMRRKD